MMVEQLLDEFDQSQELMLKELRKINAKGDLTKEELCMLKEIAEATYKMQIVEAMFEDGDGGVSEYYDDQHMTSNRGRGSYARGRSMRTGRYVSRRGDYTSGHSLHDRMIAALEDTMDQAKSDYDRQQIREWIHKIQMDENKQ